MEHGTAVDVLICGAGAAGLTLAIDLARRGVSFRLIDRIDQPFAGSRGKGIQPRTLEIFEDIGIIASVMAVGGPYPPQRIHRPDGSSHDEQGFTNTAPTENEPYGAPLMVPQFRTEAVMRDRLATLGRGPGYAHSLESFDQDSSGIVARIVGADGIETLRCRYLIGADGGRSTVRNILGIGFPGKTLGVRAIVADITLDGLNRTAWHRFNDGDMQRQVAICPLPQSDQFQLQAPIPLEGEPDLSVAGLQAFVDDRLGEGRLKVKSVNWASAYNMNARLADVYRAGNVFLVGDAAHIHPPTGGQGLNTSIQDAYNLGWKLGSVLSGAPVALLDTYEEERRPIAAGMLGLSTDLLAKAQQGDMRRGRDVQQLDLSYAGSSLSFELPARSGGLLAGDRMPDTVLRGPDGRARRLFDLMNGPHWTLLAFGTPTDPLPGVLVCALGDAPPAFLGLRQDDLVLIRPDGYIGAIADRTERDALHIYLANVTAGCHPESIRFPMRA